MSTLKHYFPGNNTSKGFYSFYRYIMSQRNARRIFCIKGGPGTGKSTLMKKIGEYYLNKGYDIEFHHCSSDNNSLDGVVIKKLNVVLLDGTSPHVVDPINPGAVDEVLNLGECWNEAGFAPYRNTIINTNKQVGNQFKRAYKYIAAAKLIHDDWCSYFPHSINWKEHNIIKENLRSRLFSSPISSSGIERHMFATAFTPNGIVTFIENLISDMDNVIVLKGAPSTGKSNILEYLADEAIRHGFYIEIFHKPLKPEKIEHIIIPELNTAVVTSNELNNLDFKGDIIDLNALINENSIKSDLKNLKIVEDDFFYILNKGLNCLKEAKNLHDSLEDSYIPNMDFKKIDAIYDNIIKRINSYED
jgi:hypothetical protein